MAVEVSGGASIPLTIGKSDRYAGFMTNITTNSSSQTPRGASVSESSDKIITPMQRRVLLGGSVGQFVEFYDLALYGIAAVSLSRLFFPSGSETAGLLMLFATYGVAFFIRPLGGLFFGALGDRVGRRNVLVATLLLIGVATTAIGLLPSFQTWGIWSTILLVLFRLLQGFSAGGESVGAPSFVYEHAPPSKRGMFVNTTLAATALPAVFASSLFLVLSLLMSSETYDAWGWRIPFLLALPMAFVGLIIRAKTEESPIFQDMMEGKAEQKQTSTPVSEAFKTSWYQMIQVVVIMGFTAMGFYFLSGYFVPYLQTTGDLSRNASLGLNAIALLLYTFLLPVFGAISDRLGRRPMMVTGIITTIVAAVPAFIMVSSGAPFVALLGQCLFVLGITMYGGGCYTFFIEVFNPKVRLTAAAFSYNLGYAVFGGTAPYIGESSVAVTGVGYAPAFYVVGLGVVVLLFLLFGRVKETRHIQH